MTARRPDATLFTRGRAAGLLVAITLLALALRWPAVHRLLPHLPEPDAFLVLHAQSLRHDPALPQHIDFAERYPTLLTRVLAAFPEARVDEGKDFVAQSLSAAARPYVQGRVLVLLLSMLLVPLTYAVARRFLRRGSSIVAAFLVATSLLHALFSTQVRPHGAHASLALLAVWAALRLADRGQESGYSNSAVLSHPNIPVFTDIFAIPSWMPLANVFSFGDVLIAAGVAVVVIGAMHTPLSSTATT